MTDYTTMKIRAPTPTRLCGTISQKSVIFILPAVRICSQNTNNSEFLTTINYEHNEATEVLGSYFSQHIKHTV
jgi:hypothetical protein